MHMQYARIYNLCMCLYTFIRQHWYIGEYIIIYHTQFLPRLDASLILRRGRALPGSRTVQRERVLRWNLIWKFLERDLVGGSLMFIVFLNRLSYLYLDWWPTCCICFQSAWNDLPQDCCTPCSQTAVGRFAAGCCSVRKDVSHRTGDFAVAWIKSFKIVQVCEWM